MTRCNDSVSAKASATKRSTAQSRSQVSWRPDANAMRRLSGDHAAPLASKSPLAIARGSPEPSAGTTNTRDGRSLIQPTLSSRVNSRSMRRGGMSFSLRVSPGAP